MANQKFIEIFLNHGAIVSKPDKRILLGWGRMEKKSSPNFDSRPHFFCSDYFLSESDPWLLFENNLELSIEQFIEYLQPFKGREISRTWVNSHKEFFRSTIEDIRKRIYLNELQKAVPFVYETNSTSMTPGQKANSLIKACELMKHFPLNLYGFWSKNEGILGLTPEILCSIQNENDSWKVNCFALAGTKDLNQRISMKSDLKTWMEHDIVRIGIVEALRDLGDISVGIAKELRLPAFTHLKTLICLEMKEKPYISQIISKLHPTPALGAYPRQQGMAWLRHYQTLIDRKKFGAPVGYLLSSKDEAHFYVAIRNVQWTLNQMQIAAGCGIVAGSRFEDEWYELHLKLQSIKKALSL